MNLVDTSKRLFFLYGIHLDPAWMAQCCRVTQVLGVASLPDYRLEFRGHTACWDGGQAVLVRHPGSVSWGVVVALDAADTHRLDTDHGVRLDGTGIYFHYPADVVDLAGREHSTLMYMLNHLGKVALPSQEYLQRMIKGARMHGLPEAWIESLAGQMAAPASYPVPRISPHSSLLDLQPNDCSG